MELTSILKQTDSLKQEAEQVQPVKPELEKAFWDKFRLEFNYNSNHMEGNTLTYGHTQLLLLFDRISGDYTGREIEEMKAHDVALKMVREVAAGPENQLNEKFIREINELILVRPYYNKAITPDGQSTRRLITPGKYKKHPNSVMLQDGEIFYYASPEETPALMGDLIEWYNNEKRKTHPVELAARFHYKLVRIHPFDDSNGRTTRLMMNYILMQNGYAPIVIESKKKEMYLAALNKADVGDINAFVDYIAGLSIRWQEIYLKAIKGEKVEEPDDFDKEVELLKKQVDNNKKIKIKFSKETALSLFSDCLFDLFKLCIDKVSKFDHFFYEKEIRFGVSGQIWIAHDVYKIQELFIELQDKVNWGTHLDLEIQHKGFRTSDNKVFNYSTSLRVYFTEYAYRITSGRTENTLAEKFYNEMLTGSENEQIALSIAKEELDEIKKRQNL